MSQPLVSLPPNFRSPQQILHDLAIQTPSEIRLEAIAEHCGATIVMEPLEGSDARLVGYRSRAIITVNSASPFFRQRFSAAHELGHWMWDRGKMSFRCQDKDYDGNVEMDGSERRANRYAVELLLPEHMFLPLLECHSLSLESAEFFSNAFRTSLVATAIRMVELTELPAVLIYAEGKKRKWYIRSKTVSRDLKLKHETPAEPQNWCLALPEPLDDLLLLAERRDLENRASLSLLVFAEQ